MAPKDERRDQPRGARRQIETRTARCWLEDGVVRTVIKEGAVVDVEDARENLGALGALGAGQAVPMVCESDGVARMTRDARALGSSAEAVAATRAMAIVGGSPIARAIGNFYLGLNKPPYPTKLFPNVEAAMAWAKSFASDPAEPD